MISMKIRTLIIIALLLLTSISLVEASSLSILNKNQENHEGQDGRIFGYVETQGRCMTVGVPNIKVACGKNFDNYEIEVTDDYGFFEFCDLTYENTGTTYFIWILPNQNVVFPGIKKVKLNDESSEEFVYYLVFVWQSVSRSKIINNFFYQKLNNLVCNKNIELFRLFFQ